MACENHIIKVFIHHKKSESLNCLFYDKNFTLQQFCTDKGNKNDNNQNIDIKKRIYIYIYIYVYQFEKLK